MNNAANSLTLGTDIRDLYRRIGGMAGRTEGGLAAMGDKSQNAQNDVLAQIMASLGRTGAGAQQAGEGASRAALDSQLAMGQYAQQALGQQAGFMGNSAQGLGGLPGFYSQLVNPDLQRLGFQNQPTVNRMNTAANTLAGAYGHEPTVSPPMGLESIIPMFMQFFKGAMSNQTKG